MLALLDVGNTSISYALVKKGRLGQSHTHLYSDIPKIVRLIGKSGGKNSVRVILSSVVPEITKKIKKSVASHKNLKLEIVGSDIPVPIKHKYHDINTLGIDRQLNIYGGQKLYGTPLLVVDYGTAITADYINSSGVFLGGMIIPGPELAFQALVQRAAKISSRSRLPKQATGFLGTSTQKCMNSGILEGYGAMTDGLIQRFRTKYGKQFKVVLTGGFAAHLKKFINMKEVQVLDPSLAFKALQNLSIKDH